MLNHQETESELAPPTGQNRVTPEELSQALAAIEARRQAEANRLAGTIPLEEAVTGLHLDSTPEEIWAEVQAQRQAKPAPEPASFAAADAARRAQLRQAQAFQTPPQQTFKQSRFKRRRWGIFAPILLVWVLVQAGVIPHFWNHHSSTSAPVVRPLAQVAEGQVFYADTATVRQLAGGAPLSEPVHLSNDLDSGWHLIKHSGQVYLQAYTLPITEQAIRAPGTQIKLYNDDDAGDLEGNHYTQVTLPLKSLHWENSQNTDVNWSEITVSHVQPDSRVWESW